MQSAPFALTLMKCSIWNPPDLAHKFPGSGEGGLWDSRGETEVAIAPADEPL